MNGLPVDVDSVGTLLAPLDPSKAIYLEQIISYKGVAASPQGGSRLVSSLISAAGNLWKMQNNLPITLDRKLRYPPFTEFSHQYLPSGNRNAKLTPWKLGIVYCWAIRGSLNQRNWPGNITALIYDSKSKRVLTAFLGRLVILDTAGPGQTSTIDSDPLQSVVGSLNTSMTNDTLVTPTTNDTLITSGTLSQPPFNAGITLGVPSNADYLEKAYLASIVAMFFRCVTYPSYEKVSNTYKTPTALYNSSSNVEVRLDIFKSSPEAPALLWDGIVRIIIELSIAFAKRPGPSIPKFAQIQVEGCGEVLARVEVGPKNLGTATS